MDRQRIASVEDGTLSHNLPQQAGAQPHKHCPSRRGAIETSPAPAGTDCRAARKAVARSPGRRLAEGGDRAILFWMLEPGAATAAPGFWNIPRLNVPGNAAAIPSSR
ncbi:hypothetical protein GCM10007320_38940 [Pseudorhodoferax aquiterrae]|uniref:Uncharacterized protein n=1 Tax=Pseudorhodoferax aquiterrae TaxID=747304 RepID=A0ABQ3G5Z2_9BURK|nr:hypothetical protein [Pseudorhodoferax aquiterrae]GHC90564.1 hypothetical protein GCM10007320_38940 [Pseudorhodoferax aquiterrae]